LEQLVEVVCAGRIPETRVIEDEVLDEVLPQHGDNPFPELNRPRGDNAVADGEHHGEIVDLDLPPDDGGTLG